MANKDNKNFVDTMVDAQKEMANTVAENTKKYANGNSFVQETIDKGSEWYKNWLDSQNNMFSSAKEKAEGMTNNGQENMGKMNEFYQNWFNTQMNWAKQMWEMNMNHMKSTTEQAKSNAADPMTAWNNNMNTWMNNWNSWSNNMAQAAQWTDMMNKWQANSPFNADAWKNAGENWTNIYNQYTELMTNSFSQLQKNMENGTTQDAYRNMVNVSEAFTRFSEMWMPFWKSIQDKSFNAESFKQWANPEMYKDMMDKYFGFMPEQSREYVQNMTNMMKDNMSGMNKSGMDQYKQMRDMMNNAMPNPTEVFGNMLNGYNKFYNMMNDAAAPFTKMMTPSKEAQTMMEWGNIANRIAEYNIKNAELQYMMYAQGMKVMDNLSENIATKVQAGEEVTSMMALYQEWLNLSDATFVELFESEEYSKAMAQVSAMQLTLRKDIEKQMEQYMVGIPVATRSEMDELYKTIYDLKKELREMKKANTTEAAPKKTTTTKAKKA